MATKTDSNNGSAYGRRLQKPNKLLTEVGPGKPLGELMRRYWQPIAVSRDVKELPRMVRVLGEDLVLFRDKSGRAGRAARRLVLSKRLLLFPPCLLGGPGKPAILRALLSLLFLLSSHYTALLTPIYTAPELPGIPRCEEKGSGPD